MEKSTNIIVFIVFVAWSLIGLLCMKWSIENNGDSSFVAEETCTPTKYVYCYSEPTDDHH